MSLRNVEIAPLRRTPPFRKIAIGTWTGPGDPQIYGTLEVDLTRALAWRDRQPADGPRITVTHMVARALGLAMRRYPDLNGFIRFKRIYLRKSVDIFFQVTVRHDSGRNDLAGLRITEVDRKGVARIAEEMAAKVERVRQRRDTELQKTSKMLSMLPGWLVGFFLNLSGFVSYALNLRLPGIPPDQFGGCMVTNVGSMGLDVAYAPLVPYARTPLIILLGEAKRRPVVVEDEEGERIEARTIVTLNATIDHRFCDGALLAKMVRAIQAVFADPDRWFEEGADPAEL